MAKNNVNEGIISAGLMDDYIEAQNENIRCSNSILKHIEHSITCLKLGIYATVIYLFIMGVLYLFF